MSDLISRQSVYDMLHGLGGCDASDEWSNGWDKAIDTAIGELNEIPTAYDVDKVVEQLEGESYIIGVNATVNSDTTADYIEGFNDMVNISLSIVKGAVKDE